MVCLDRVVAVLLGDVTGGGQQLLEHPRVGRRPVGGHFGRCWAVLQGTGEEPAGGVQNPFLGDEDVDDLTELVDRPIQIDPSPGDFDVCFIDEPPVAGDVAAGSCRVDEQWGEALHPPVHAHVIDVDAPLRQQFFHVAVAEGKAIVEPDGVRNDVLREPKAFVGWDSSICCHAGSIARLDMPAAP